MENNFYIDSANLSESALKKKHLLENNPKSRTNHMEYMPGMEKIDSDICKNVMAYADSYDYENYTGKDVERALQQEIIGINELKILLSPAAEPYLSLIHISEPTRPY